MAYRSVLVANGPSRIYTRHRQLCIQSEDDRSGRIPLEDLGILIVETRQATVTSACVDESTANGAAIVFCGHDHLPSALALALAGNSKHTERLRNQIEAPEALKRQLWAHIVRMKIRGQVANLPEGAAKNHLRRLIGKVRSGDPQNLEAQAARSYWGEVFSGNGNAPFRRRAGNDGPNAHLNYGYAILRAAIGRALVASGLHPALGIHHSSRTNPFCLADDLLELYRPLVDRRVRDWIEIHGVEFSKGARAHLVAHLGESIPYGKESGPLSHVIDLCAASLAGMFDRAARARSRIRWERMAPELIVPSYEIQ